MQLTCILLNYTPYTKEQIEKLEKDSEIAKVREIIGQGKESIDINQFLEIIKGIDDFKNLQLIYIGLKKICEEALVKSYQRDLMKEAMHIFVRISQSCPNFFDVLYLNNIDFNFILVFACHYITNFGRTPGCEGLAYLNLLMLYYFSQSIIKNFRILGREFGIHMNDQYKFSYSVDLGYTEGSYADCFIVFVCDMVMSKSLRLDYIRVNLLVILSNL